jgi:hypothetical protein
MQTRQGLDCPDTLYWPVVHGEVGGALRAELACFADCVARGTPPTVVTPEEAGAAAAESARTGQVVRL